MGNKSLRKDILRHQTKSTFTPEAISNLGCFVFSMVANGFVGWWSVDLLLSLVGYDIPFIGDLLIGLLIGQVTIPVAVVVAILQYFGVL